METKNNVIDFASFKRSAPYRTNQQDGEEFTGVTGQIIALEEHKIEAVGSERRGVRRTMLSEFVGAFIVVPEVGLQEVCLYDISDGGVAFDLEIKYGQFKIGEEIAARFYLSQNNYFTFNVHISNVRMLEDEGVFRHGTRIVRENHNFEAIDYFIKFVEAVSSIVKIDKGDLRAPANRR